jgi:hypothetical protein
MDSRVPVAKELHLSRYCTEIGALRLVPPALFIAILYIIIIITIIIIAIFVIVIVFVVKNRGH